MSSTLVLENALTVTLQAATGLTALLSSPTAVYREEAPPDVVPPFVVFEREDSEPMRVLAGEWAHDHVYVVRGVTAGHSALLAGSIDAQLAAALEDRSFALSAGSVIYCRRESDVDYADQAPGGVRYMHRGGAYRIWTT